MNKRQRELILWHLKGIKYKHIHAWQLTFHNFPMKGEKKKKRTWFCNKTYVSWFSSLFHSCYLFFKYLLDKHFYFWIESIIRLPTCHRFFVGCPSWCNPPNLSRLETGTKTPLTWALQWLGPSTLMSVLPTEVTLHIHFNECENVIDRQEISGYSYQG